MSYIILEEEGTRYMIEKDRFNSEIITSNYLIF